MKLSEIGLVLQYHRKKNNMTMEDIGGIIGVNRKVIAGCEKGKPSINIRTYINYANYIGQELVLYPDNDDDNKIDKFIRDVIKKMEMGDIITPQTARCNNRTHKYGWVYLITNSKKSGQVKIGMTKKDNPKDRAKELDTIYGKGHKVFHARLAENCYNTEREMHTIFKKYRETGEWFIIDLVSAKKTLDDIVKNNQHY